MFSQNKSTTSTLIPKTNVFGGRQAPSLGESLLRDPARASAAGVRHIAHEEFLVSPESDRPQHADHGEEDEDPKARRG